MFDLEQISIVEESHEMLAQAAPSGEEVECFCACGCGRQFVPRRKNQRYFEDRCRERFRQSKMALIRVPIEEIREIKVGIARRKAKRSMVPRISGTEGYESMVSRRIIFLVASWLKCRLLEEQAK